MTSADPVEPPALADDPLRRCLAALLDAADAADALGIPSAGLREAHEDGTARLGFPSDAYVLALVGGTGVGKSSLLNALAGTVVSRASARRPTTSEAVAWVPDSERDTLAPLLDWLDVRDVREHDATVPALASVAVLDLPDMDSVEASHRARVEAILPRVDAVAWIADPEKYHDAVLHDEFLRTWMPRLARQALVLNKADRLADDDRRRVRRDLEADLDRRRQLAGASDIPVLVTTATPAVEIEQLTDWLADGATSKAIVRARVGATVAELGRRLAQDAGIGGPEAGRERPFLPDRARAAATDDALQAILRIVDLSGVEAQAVGATRARARARGTGPIGRLTSLVYQASGQATRAADPEGYLMRWRERGSLAPAVEALRQPVAATISEAPPTLRPALAQALETDSLRRGVERAIDRSIAGLDRLQAPSSRWWGAIGLLQTLTTVAIAISAAWLVVWILARPPVESVRLPVVGPVPMPFVALGVALLVGYLLARVLGIHAGSLGRRWARQVADRISVSVRREVAEGGLAELDRLQAAHRRLATAIATIERSCGS